MCGQVAGGKRVGCGWLLALVGALGLSLADGAWAQQTVTLTVSTPEALREAIRTANADPQSIYEILIDALELRMDNLDGSGSALPPIEGEVAIISALGPDRVRIRGGGPGSNFRLVEVRPGGRLVIDRMDIEDFNTEGSGGVILMEGGDVQNPQRLSVKDSIIRNCRARDSGGAVAARGAGNEIAFFDTDFRGCSAQTGGGLYLEGVANILEGSFTSNQADQGGAVAAASNSQIVLVGVEMHGNKANVGGAVAAEGAVAIQYVKFKNNTATAFGCDVVVLHNDPTNLDSSVALLFGNQFQAEECSTETVKIFGSLTSLMFNNLLLTANRAITNSGNTEMRGNILRLGGGNAEKSAGAKLLCVDFGGCDHLAATSPMTRAATCSSRAIW
jgi:hypothetical protein